jgi:hypothetical protein
MKSAATNGPALLPRYPHHPADVQLEKIVERQDMNDLITSLVIAWKRFRKIIRVRMLSPKRPGLRLEATHHPANTISLVHRPKQAQLVGPPAMLEVVEAHSKRFQMLIRKTFWRTLMIRQWPLDSQPQRFSHPSISIFFTQSPKT